MSFLHFLIHFPIDYYGSNKQHGYYSLNNHYPFDLNLIYNLGARLHYHSDCCLSYRELDCKYILRSAPMLKGRGVLSITI